MNTEGKYRKTIEAIPIIMSLRNEGKSIRDIAKSTKVSPNTVRSVLNPNAKINTLGATSKILRLLISCLNESISNTDKALKEEVAKYPDSNAEDVYMDLYYDLSLPTGIIQVINSWLDKLDAIDDTPHARGATIALTQLIQYLSYIDKIGVR